MEGGVGPRRRSGALPSPAVEENHPLVKDAPCLRVAETLQNVLSDWTTRPPPPRLPPMNAAPRGAPSSSSGHPPRAGSPPRMAPGDDPGAPDVRRPVAPREAEQFAGRLLGGKPEADRRGAGSHPARCPPTLVVAAQGRDRHPPAQGREHRRALARDAANGRQAGRVARRLPGLRRGRPEGPPGGASSRVASSSEKTGRRVKNPSVSALRCIPLWVRTLPITTQVVKCRAAIERPWPAIRGPAALHDERKAQPLLAGLPYHSLHGVSHPPRHADTTPQAPNGRTGPEVADGYLRRSIDPRGREDGRVRRRSPGAALAEPLQRYASGSATHRRPHPRARAKERGPRPGWAAVLSWKW